VPAELCYLLPCIALAAGVVHLADAPRGGLNAHIICLWQQQQQQQQQQRRRRQPTTTEQKNISALPGSSASILGNAMSAETCNSMLPPLLIRQKTHLMRHPRTGS
jgi:hypothetical protein